MIMNMLSVMVKVLHITMVIRVLKMMKEGALKTNNDNEGAGSDDNGANKDGELALTMKC